MLSFSEVNKHISRLPKLFVVNRMRSILQIMQTVSYEVPTKLNDLHRMKIQVTACMKKKESNQPAHPRSLIGVFRFCKYHP